MSSYPMNAEGQVLHANLTDGCGTAITFVRMTEEPCPVCFSPHGGRIGILFETTTSETVHCQRCDYTLSRPHRDAPGRKMNQGRG